MRSFNKYHIGTSGWHYSHWKGVFYTEDVSEKDFLKFYSSYFRTVEINSSFYKVPERKTLQLWKKTTGRDFIFSVKASRYITHMKKLTSPRESLDRFFNGIEGLEENCGPILFQLPPAWKINVERLKNFLSQLSKEYRYAFEFRNESWHVPEVYELLKKHNVVFCIYDMGGVLSPEILTGNYIYVRLHGPDSAYKGSYDWLVLRKWAEKFISWIKKGLEIYCYFDNDHSGYAVTNALYVQDLLWKHFQSNGEGTGYGDKN